jgi:hypothetical protein
MTFDTSGDVAVVKPYYATEEAYNMGYKRFSDLSGEETKDFDLAPYHGSAEYCNHVLPKLRCMAGFADPGGHGTWQGHRQVAAIRPGCEEDEPAEADLADARTLHDTLVEAFTAGAYDAVDGNEKDPDEYW